VFRLLTALAFVLIATIPSVAMAQQPLKDVLSFLLINRSIPTGDFARDELAAARTRDAIVGFLQAELATLPVNSPASGFTYRLDPDLGAPVRTSENFGPFFMERSLTGGRQFAFGLAYTQSAFDNIDGRDLRAGTLVASASRQIGEAQPFDAETLTLNIRTRTMTLSGQAGLTDRLDIGVSLPFVRVDFSGSRVDTYRGTRLVQATALGAASGVGDLLIRAKYNFLRRGGGGLSLAADARIATGDADNLLGSGRSVFRPRLIGSVEHGAVAAHGEVGYHTDEIADELDFGGAVTFAANSRVTLIGEVIGRRLSSGGRLVDVVEPHPSLVGIETIRLTSTEQPTTRALIVAGLRWNVASRWLISGNVMRPVTTAGLNSRWVASAIFDYSIGR
jgi:Putative MetA-pathway of phenol degradation